MITTMTQTMYGEFAIKKTIHGDKIIWISWGDYMQWDLQSIRLGIIAFYGKDAGITEMACHYQ